jgi:sortase A
MKIRMNVPNILIIIGLGVVFIQLIINMFIQPYLFHTISKQALTINASTILDNINQGLWEEDTDVKVVNSWEFPTTINTKSVVGMIAIPAVNLKLPILNGASKRHLAQAAATIKPHQIMGQGNYAIAGHLTRQQDTLFSPLHRVKINDLIYLSDKQQVYTYQVTIIKVVNPNAIEVINDQEEQSLVTLVTCQDLQAKERLIIQAALIEVEDYVNSKIEF